MKNLNTVKITTGGKRVSSSFQLKCFFEDQMFVLENHYFRLNHVENLLQQHVSQTILSYIHKTTDYVTQTTIEKVSDTATEKVSEATSE